MISASSPDPYRLKEWEGFISQQGWQWPMGRAQRSSILANPSNTKIIIVGGQSNMATACGSGGYTTVSSQALNLNIYDGALYAGMDPCLGCGWDGVSNVSSVNMRLADSVISRGKAATCIVVPIAIGGTAYSLWTPSGPLFSHLAVAIARVRALGREPDFIIWGEGESDNAAGTSAATVTANINAIVDGIRAAPISCNTPFYVGYYTQLDTFGISATVRAGITNSIDNAGRKIFAGIDADNNVSDAGGFRNAADHTHFNNSGLTTAALFWSQLILP